MTSPRAPLFKLKRTRSKAPTKAQACSLVSNEEQRSHQLLQVWGIKEMKIEEQDKTEDETLAIPPHSVQQRHRA